jgi:NAD(P)-dependent dehydrogenase (short-subunit alcohol dehydrogenase family)
MATVLVTGANRGIGLELCRQLTRRGDTVIGACRAPSAELKALGVRITCGIDVADAAGPELLAAELAGVDLDVLVNNAGVLSVETLDDLDLERVRHQFEVNALGPLRVTAALLPNLKRGAVVAIVSSRVGSLTDNRSGGVYGYRISKAAVNMAGVNLAHDLRERGVSVAILHPGLVATEMTGGEGIPAAEAAAGLIARIDASNLENTGTFWHANGEPLPW